MAITVWTKLGCGWCYEVTDLLRERGLPFEERVVTGNREYFTEMIRKSGQMRAPVVEIDGHLLIDTDAGEVARFLDHHAGAASPNWSVGQVVGASALPTTDDRRPTTDDGAVVGRRSSSHRMTRPAL